MSIEFRFHPRKAVEASALLLKLHGGPMKYLGLLKMLYRADRRALDQIEQSITGDDSVSMKYGPVLSGVYDLIKGNKTNESLSIWNKFICLQDENFVKLLEFPEIEELCEEEEDILTEVYKQFGKIDPFTVAEWTHSLPEWQDPKMFNKKAVPIAIEDILRNLGKTNQEIEIIRQEAIREAYLDEVLND